MTFSAGVQAPTRLALRGGEADVAAQEIASAREVGKTLEKEEENKRRQHVTATQRSCVILDSALPTIQWQSNNQRNKVNHTNSHKRPLQEKQRASPPSAAFHPGSQFVPRCRSPWRTTSILDIRQFKGGA